MGWFFDLFSKKEPERKNVNASVLKVGSKGYAVENLQELLFKALGSEWCPYSRSGIDGDFGPNTEKAVMIFQAKYEFIVDGIAGPLTRNMLESLFQKKPAEDKHVMELTCPFADQSLRMSTKGKFKKGYPKGAVVHFTAGSTGVGSVNYGKSRGYAFWMIDRDGMIYQTHSLNKWGYHAGKSKWKGLGSSLSNQLLGIEMANAGQLERISSNCFKSWFGREYTRDQVRHSEGDHQNIEPGYYEKLTAEQEESLISLLGWLEENNPEIFKIDNVLGHDEISPGRKNDPGAALSLSMPDFRTLLKKQKNETD